MSLAHFYRRNLPHIQSDAKPHFVTFCTRNRWTISESLRTEVLEICLREHQRALDLLAVVVMPDHVHMICTPLVVDGATTPLHSVLRTVKGVSAHRINRALDRKGKVWQEESFDHVLRSSESLDQKIAYILDNPIRRQLTTTRREYPWLWTADAEILTSVPLKTSD